MKNLLISALLISLLAQPAIAQKGALWGGFSAGYLKGDIANSSLLTDFVDYPGFQTGAFLQFGLQDEFAVQLELLYEQRNFATNNNILGLRPGTNFNEVCWPCYFRSNISYQSDFIVFPISIKYEHQRNSLIIHAQAGLFYALLISNFHNGFEELYLDPSGMSGITDPLMEPGLYRTVYSGLSTNVINTYDAGFLLGVGLSYAIGPKTKLMLNGRSNIGFAGIYENPKMPVVNYKSYLLSLALLRKIYQR
jgi:opacity protein-like surface antigen